MSGNAVHLLALHGFTGCGADFSEFAALCGSGLHWHCPDLPGHCRTPSEQISPAGISDFLRRESTALARPRILLGYSMGARAALLQAADNAPEWDGLILISPNPGIESPRARAQRREADEALARKIESEGVGNFLREWAEHPLIRSQQRIPAAWRSAMRRNRRNHTAEGLAASLRSFGAGAFPDLWPRLPELNLPVLLLTGAEDTKYTAIAKRMASLLPEAEHAILPQAGHMPHLENATAAVRALRAHPPIQHFSPPSCKPPNDTQPLRPPDH